MSAIHEQVSGPSTSGLRIDAKTDFHRLIAEAEVAQVTLEVTIDDDRYEFEPRRKAQASVST